MSFYKEMASTQFTKKLQIKTQIKRYADKNVCHVRAIKLTINTGTQIQIYL